MENYVNMNSQRSKEKNRLVLDQFKRISQAVFDILTKNYPGVKIFNNYSRPQGNWPDVPWMAFGTPSNFNTDKGTFSLNINYQFTADMSGVLLVILPFTKEWRELYGKEWLTDFKPYRDGFRNQLDWMKTFGFHLDDEANVATKALSGTSMKNGYIVYKYYPATNLPSEEELQKDLVIACKAQMQISEPDDEHYSWALPIKNMELSAIDFEKTWIDWQEGEMAEIILPQLNEERAIELSKAIDEKDFVDIALKFGINPEQSHILWLFSNMKEKDVLFCINNKYQAIGKGNVKSEVFIDEDDTTHLFREVTWEPIAVPKDMPADLRSKVMKW